ncbi:MAG: FHA domain-containing protein [Planctomycetaceae bacterium]
MTIELRAVGLDENQVEHITLLDDILVRIGRSKQADMVIAWDDRISREHADLKWNSDGLQVRCLGNATNPIIVNGEPVRELTIDVGGEFMIGQTSFRLIDNSATPSMQEHDDDAILTSQTYDANELNNFEFSDPIGQMEMLARLPGLISKSASDDNLAGLIVDILMETIPAGVAVAVMRYDRSDDDGSSDPPQEEFDPARPVMMRVATQDGYTGRFRPSRRMIRSSLETGKSVLHIWDGESTEGQFTVSGGLDWAFCTPVQTAETSRWCLYVAGQGSVNQGLLIDDDALKGDMRFVELVAQFIGSIVNVRLLEEQKTQLSSFFSPLVINSLLGQESQPLEPSQQDISVLFCDVRGFSHLSEMFQDDLFHLLATGKKALGLMANSILENDGAIADFQGDAALGFWGWPVSLTDGPVPACRAALKIVEVFNNSGDESLAGVLGRPVWPS